MLDTLITSKTRIKLLLKFFTNNHSSAYLRGLAEEFGESTNAIRHELNNLSRAGYIISSEKGRTIQYTANVDHPLYNEVKNLIHKYLGIDKLIDSIISRLGDLSAAFIIGDYARGKDSGTVELVLVGSVDKIYLDKLVVKANTIVKRKIKAKVISDDQFNATKEQFNSALMIWKK